MYCKYYKRIMDFFISLLLLAVFSPIFIILTIIGALNFKVPFYMDRRAGLNGRLISIIKFKSMNDKTDSSGNLLPDSKRLCWYGKVIRKLSLDELPQLFNVAMGDMSLIGPRPLFAKYLPLYSDEQRRRHLVRPGITGWAQINGRNSISWQDKFKYDVYYVEHVSFRLDWKILCLTVKKVLIREGINARDSVPMDAFEGSIDGD